MIRETMTNAAKKGTGLSKLVAALALAIMMAFSMLLVPATGAKGKAFADEAASSGYKYTITLYAGAGTINGGDSVTFGDLSYGNKIALAMNNMNDEGTAMLYAGGNTYSVVPDDDRYYPKGIRLAGADESSYALPSINVTESQQYVIAYGLKQDRVAYTVEYVDQNGNELTPSQTFYGNVGDKPVAAFQYIEGYVPNAYNITGTLDADASKNVFRFVYQPAPAGSGYEVVYINRGFTLATGPAVAMQAAAEEGTLGEGAAADAAAEEATEPVELIDLDDDETPLASGIEGASVDSGDASLMPAVPLAFGLLALAAVLVALIVVFRRKASRTDAK